MALTFRTATLRGTRRGSMGCGAAVSARRNDRPPSGDRNPDARKVHVSDAEIRIVRAGSDRDTYLPLLRLADDSESEVRRYYQTGDLYVLDDDAATPLGVALAVPRSDGSVELKAIAIDAALHRRGIGQRILAAVLADLTTRGVTRVVVGTGNSGVGQLAFYQKAGFRLWKIERDFFGPERGYPDGLEENGIPLRDMVWMDQTL
jgi:ribosomal protein S18 acetylase RimI-like enzyme